MENMKLSDKQYWKIHAEGREKCEQLDNDCSKVNNPYKKGTEKWKAWNKGWNSF